MYMSRMSKMAERCVPFPAPMSISRLPSSEDGSAADSDLP